MEYKYIDRYLDWVNSDVVDDKSKEELSRLENETEEIEDRFGADLTFGTGGIRGLMGVGTNRINIYNIRKVTQGLANFINNSADIRVDRSVAIAYDSRNNSEVFALEAALVLNACNIKVYLFDSLRSTPELSFAVRYLNCVAGIVITASHNPPEYNGCKVYGSDGGQITLQTANAIISEINLIDIFKDVKTIDWEVAEMAGLLVYIGEDIDNAYLSKVIDISLKKGLSDKVKDFKIVYTPLHGSGLMPVTKALSMLGYKDIHLVESQAKPDGNFPTIKTPNPEAREAYEEGIRLAEKIDADIIMATDPDCDRIGAAIKDKDGVYTVLTGNQTGALLVDYILSSKKEINSRHAVINTIVTSDLGSKIARSYGASVFNTLTGFKFIGEKISQFEETKEYEFLFGYEESYGYLTGTFVRDKDAVIASVLIVEMSAYYKSLGMSLFDALEKIYKEFGYHCDELENYPFIGIDSMQDMKNVVSKFLDIKKLHNNFSGIDIIEDYTTQIRTYISSGKNEAIDLPVSDVVKVRFKDGIWFAVRPSGTEPKLKIYYSTVGTTIQNAKDKMKRLQKMVANYMYI